MKRWPLQAVIAVLLWFAYTAVAQADWSGTARLGLLSTSGNSDADSYNARFELRYDNDRWENRVNALALGAREDRDTTAEAYELGGRITYSPNSDNFWFLRGQGRRDRFGGFGRQVSQSAGIGRRLLERERQRLDVEFGGGARQARRQDGERVDEAILRMATEYRYYFSDTTRFDLELGSERGEDNTATEMIASVRSQVMSRVALVVSYRLLNNSRVPDDRTHTDSLTSISLEYAF